MKIERDSVFLVTGGAGFIGSNICERLLELGFKVKCVDNLSTGKIENIKVHLNNRNMTFIEGDIRNFDTCFEVCKGVDYVLHQAAWGSVPRSIEMPLEYEENNIKGTLNMMEAAKRNRIKRFIYASSSSVYGNNKNLLKREGEEGEVISPYALTKMTNEKYGKLYWQLYRLPTIGLRYFNVFGKNQDPYGQYAAVIPRFIKNLIYNERPVIYGDGSQTRDFTYVKNVVEANILACEASNKAVGLIFNIACGNSISIYDLFQYLCQLFKTKIEPNFLPARVGDVPHSLADITLAKEFLGYTPKYSVWEGLKEALDWYKINIAREPLSKLKK